MNKLNALAAIISISALAGCAEEPVGQEVAATPDGAVITQAEADVLEQRADRLEERMDMVEGRLDATGADGVVEARSDVLEDRADRVEDRTDVIEEVTE